MKTIIVKWQDNVTGSIYTLHETESLSEDWCDGVIDELGDPAGVAYRHVPKAKIPTTLRTPYEDNKADEEALREIWESLTSKVHYIF